MLTPCRSLLASICNGIGQAQLHNHRDMGQGRVHTMVTSVSQAYIIFHLQVTSLELAWQCRHNSTNTISEN